MSDRDRKAISERDLHALVDGQLPADRQAAVEAWLADRPEAGAAVADWRAQNEAIRRLFAAEPAAADAFAPRKPRDFRPSRFARWRTLAASLLLVLGGGAAGWFANAALAPAPAGYVETLPEASRANYLIYASEVRHPVEVGADQEAHLVAWLGKRLGASLVAPDLAAQHFRLVGGRLVPYAGKPGAMLMYENGAGQRLTVMIGTNMAHEGTNFRYEQKDGVGTFYWVDNQFGYALSGALSRDELLTLATAIYRQQ